MKKKRKKILLESQKLIDELNILEGKSIESKSYLAIQENHFMEEINEIQSRLKKLEKDKKLSDPVDFYDFSNLKRRK